MCVGPGLPIWHKTVGLLGGPTTPLGTCWRSRGVFVEAFV